VRNDPTSRLVTFLAMIFVATSHMLAKTLASALLIAVNGTWLVYYMVIDMVVYLLLKAARGDLRYWLNISGVLGWAFTGLSRVIVKVLLDFTSNFHMRHSNEVGGILFCVSLIQNQVACFVAALVYLKYKEGDEAALSSESLLGTLLLLLSIWFISIAIFICYMDRSYLHTFYGTTTGSQLVH
jgi:hypothetical protein